MAIYPKVEEVLQQTNEKTIFQVKRSLRSILSSFFLFAFSLATVYFLNLWFRDFKPFPNIPVLEHITLRWLALIPCLVLLEIIRKYHDDLYVFSTDTVTRYGGRLSLNYLVPAIKYTDIKGIAVTQDIVGRVFDYGKVELGTAAQDSSELTLEGVRAPVELGKVIEQLRDYNIELDKSKKTNGE